MSDVYKSARRPTKLEVFVYATDLTEALLSACHNSNVIPKSYRYELFICPKYRIKEEDYVPVA